MAFSRTLTIAQWRREVPSLMDVDNSDSSASASTAPSSFAGPAESNSTYMYFLRFFALLC